MRLWATAAAIATIAERIVINNAGDTMPVMSSPLSREMIINVTMPTTIKAQTEIAEYFTVVKNFLKFFCIFVAS